MSRPRYPALFQVNTRVRLSELAAALGRNATLDDIPDVELDRLAADGFDIVWFLGVWQTGEAARSVSRSHSEWLAGVPSRPSRLPRGRRLRLLFRDSRLSCPHGLRRRRSARPAPPAPSTSRSAPGPRFRSEPRGPGSPLGRRSPGLLRGRHGGAARRSAPELLSGGDGPGHACAGVRARPVLRWLARHVAAELRQRRSSRGDAWGARANRPAVRWRPLRHGDARPARGLPENLGHRRTDILAPSHGHHPSQGPELPLSRRGLLGPRMDPSTAGLRLHLRQAALRPPDGRPPTTGPRPPLGGT